MSKNPSPLKARHLRLLPPLSDEPGEDASTHALDPKTWAQALPAVHLGPSRSRLPWAVLGLLGLVTLWAFAAPPPPRHVAHRDASHIFDHAAMPGPSFEAYARGRQGATLGRPLMEGDPLFAEDHLILGIHNAPAPGVEAAQFAAVFAIDQDRHVAALYPALGAEAVAMPLPQVTSMALLDGPQLAGAQGPISLVALFLRQQVAMGALTQALSDSAAKGDLQAVEAAPALGGALVRLQSLTLAHQTGSVTGR